MHKPFFIPSQGEGGNSRITFEPHILLLNTDTLNNDKAGELQVDIGPYQQLTFLCLVEVGARQDSISSLHIDGFDLITSYCRPVMRKGGVGIWARSGFCASEVDVHRFCVDLDIEVCAVKFRRHDDRMLLLTC